MRRKLLALLLIAAVNHTLAQTCMHTSLSTTYNFKTSVACDSNSIGAKGYCIISVTVIDKATKKELQTIKTPSGLLFEDAYENCAEVRSYSTGKNKSKEVVDNEYGDLIVADLNFDSKEDLAIKYDSGGNSGPYYAFFIQSSKGKFTLDSFLTEEMSFFPSIIDAKDKTLTTYGHAGALYLGKHVFAYSTKSKKCRLKYYKLLDVREH